LSVTGELKCLCARCAEVQGSCCQKKEILLTRGDLIRISTHIGHFDFHELRVPTDPAYLEQDDDPNWNLWTLNARGERRVLKVRADRSCLFLTETGCVLPYETRPLVCRLFPYTYNEQGIIAIEQECPTELLAPGETLMSCLGMDRDKALRWHGMLYGELRAAGE
jgi:Fe-S-cluster containining protein